MIRDFFDAAGAILLGWFVLPALILVLAVWVAGALVWRVGMAVYGLVMAWRRRARVRAEVRRATARQVSRLVPGQRDGAE